MSLYHIYTDGACSGNPGPGGWGVVILDEQENFLLELSGFAAATTNNRMEIQAALEGIRKALELCPSPELVLYSDSNYLIQAYTKGWMNSWLRTGWKKGTVKNQDLWQALNTLLSKVKIRWVKVKGHADNFYNNRCDQLAVAAIKHSAPGAPVFEEQPLKSNPKEARTSGTSAGIRRVISAGVSTEQVILPSFDPNQLNNPLSNKPSENRCLVARHDLEQNVAKIRQVVEKYKYEDIKKYLDPGVLKSVNSWVGTATFNHPNQKVHPFFLQVGDMADLWLRNNTKYPMTERADIVKLICTFVANNGVSKARELGLEK